MLPLLVSYLISIFFLFFIQELVIFLVKLIAVYVRDSIGESTKTFGIVAAMIRSLVFSVIAASCALITPARRG